MAVLLCGATAADFHAPTTQAERALDGIIQTADSDTYLLDNLLGRAAVPRDRQVDYGKFLTRPLVETLRHDERQMVNRDCGGVYLAGEICGFDFDLINCAQDSDPARLFQTVSDTRPTTIVRLRYGQDGSGGTNTYRLVREGGTWKIDDILCAEDKASFRKLLSPQSADQVEAAHGLSGQL